MPAKVLSPGECVKFPSSPSVACVAQAMTLQSKLHAGPAHIYRSFVWGPVLHSCRHYTITVSSESLVPNVYPTA